MYNEHLESIVISVTELLGMRETGGRKGEKESKRQILLRESTPKVSRYLIIYITFFEGKFHRKKPFDKARHRFENLFKLDIRRVSSDDVILMSYGLL
jgi:hypothetical protein